MCRKGTPAQLVLDADDRDALFALLSARDPQEARRQAARLRALLGDQVELLEPHIEALLARAAELQRARHLAATDPLTGAANRRGFADGLRRELARAARSGKPLSLLLLDIDGFKAINDRFGHACGDRVLREVTACARKVTRGLDLVARIGGDEIALMLPETDATEARAIAQRIRGELARRGDEPQVGVSIGLAVTRAAGLDAAALLASADRDLYRDKAVRRAHSAAR